MKRVLFSIAVFSSLLIFAAACQPKTVAPPVSAVGPGYTIRFAVLGAKSDALYIVRDIDCTVIAYAGGRPILIKDTEGGEGIDQLAFHVRTNTMFAPEIRILDQAGADTVKFICTMPGVEGDSLDCEVAVIGSDASAPMLGAQEFDLIEQATGVAICSGTINLRA